MSKQTRKPVKWVSSAKRDLDAMPDYVKDVFGHAIDLAQADRPRADGRGTRVQAVLPLPAEAGAAGGPAG